MVHCYKHKLSIRAKHESTTTKGATYSVKEDKNTLSGALSTFAVQELQGRNCP